MKITIESTTKMVTLMIDGAELPARVWQGETASGIPVVCFVTAIAPEIPKGDPGIDALTVEFDRDLERYADPRPTVAAIDPRFII